MNAKTNFLHNKELAKWWASIAHDSRFTDVLTHARSFIMESTPERSVVQGAEHLISVLETMTDNPETGMDFPSPGLVHNVDSMPDIQTDEQSDAPKKSNRKKK